jgi:hypothetical protein
MFGQREAEAEAPKNVRSVLNDEHVIQGCDNAIATRR